MPCLWRINIQWGGNRNPSHSSCCSRWTRFDRQPSALTQSVSQTGTLKIQVNYLEIRLEPDDGKLSSPVLRGGESGDARTLPDPAEWVTAPLSLTIRHMPIALLDCTNNSFRNAIRVMFEFTELLLELLDSTRSIV